MSFEVRMKCREMLAGALKLVDTAEGSADPDDMATRLEEAIYDELRNSEFKYKNRIRSRLSNLRDPKNPELREKYMRGEISPDTMAKMTPEDMATDDLKRIRQSYSKQAINQAQMRKVQGTKTDVFKCDRCQKRNCIQLHTQDGDEPMITFVICEECGHRWKG
ncbi:transcription elongation factor S-II [Drosophila eugracilis]|uniref:transcription elongation factor S-II n=1 Tax=Drosophila eugracilis TaxID=29029 RepID=UPI0007E660DB|nr:transcription elongation factor S-II [Drosophila eugracilis]